MDKLTIAFDAKRAAQNRTGLGNYSRFVVRALSRYTNVGRLLLYAPNPQRVSALEGIDEEERTAMRYPRSFWSQTFCSLWRVWGITNRLHEDGVRLFHGLSNELPLNIRKARGLRSVVTIHDLIFRPHPECYHLIDRLIYDFKFRRACRNADRIIAVSECTKRDIVKYYGTDPSKIDVVYQGCDPSFSRIALPEEKEYIRQQYQLPEHFILYLGSIERRKNLMLLAKALKHLPSDTKVVAVGKRTRYADDVEAYVRANGLQDRLMMLSGIPFSALPAMYQMADVFVYPSRYEGFGIPILEALVSGTPVVACTGSCLEEAGGPETLYVSPDDDGALANAISRITNSTDLRHKMILAGREYAQRFSMLRVAGELMKVYEKVMAQ